MLQNIKDSLHNLYVGCWFPYSNVSTNPCLTRLLLDYSCPIKSAIAICIQNSPTPIPICSTSMQRPQRSEEGTGSSGIGVTEGWEPPLGAGLQQVIFSRQPVLQRGPTFSFYVHQLQASHSICIYLHMFSHITITLLV